MEKIQFVQHPDLDDYIESDKTARIYAEEIIRQENK
jgi:hypothetical protein